MAEFFSVLAERRSIRKYEDRPVPPELLAQLLEAVRMTPSWANTQCWEVVVVGEAATKEKLAATLGKGNPATRAVAAAPLVLVICGKKQASGYYNGVVTTKHGDWLLFDLGIFTQSICLAAHAMGLGTVVVGLFDHAQAAKVLGVPEGYELVTMLPLGYPAQEVKAPRRKEVAEFVHRERWGGK